MFEYLYEWLRDLSFYLILVTAITHILPGNGYKKYIRFFTGLVLIMMLLTPVFQICGAEYKVAEFYKGYDFEEKMKNVNEEIEMIEDEMENRSKNQIKVEEIIIGP